MADEPIRSVVIATTNCEKALYIVAKDAMLNDDLELHYTEKYAPTVEYLLRILRKAFGWMETDRGTKDVVNTKCKYNENGYCVCSKVVTNPGDKGEYHCKESVRMNCKHYAARFENRITVNYVSIEKAGQIRAM